MPDNPLGTSQRDFQIPVRPEPSTALRTKGLVEGLVLAHLVVRQAHHERPNGLSGLMYRLFGLKNFQA